MENAWAIDAIVNTIEKCGKPLTEVQRIALAGSLGVVLDRVYHQGITVGITVGQGEGK